METPDFDFITSTGEGLPIRAEGEGINPFVMPREGM
jgi:hypothetical protein